MPTYTMTGPDGKSYSIDGPPGASQADVQAQMQAHFGAQAQAQQPQAPQAPQASPQAPPPRAGGDLGGSLYAGVHGFEDMATFGQGDKLAAITSTLTENVGQLLGLDKSGITKAPQSYGQNLQDIQGTASQEAANHPIANAAGEVAGLIPGVGVAGLASRGIGTAARALPGGARIAEALAPAANAPIANTAKALLGNAAVGTGLAAANGQSAPQALQTGAISGVLGTAAGRGASFALEKMAPAAQRAYGIVAEKLGLKPGELETAVQNYQRITGGATPMLAGLANLKAQGRLAELVKANPTIGEKAATATSPTLMTPSEQGIVKIAQGGGPQTAADLFDLRKANMDKSMEAIRDTPVPYSPRTVSLLSDPLVTHALRQNAQVLGDSSLLGKVRAYVSDGPSGSHLTLDDVDQIRESLRNRQATFANPTSVNHDRNVAREFGQVAGKVEQLGTTTNSAYGDALDHYKQDSDYLNGFQHGTQGKGIGEANPGSETAFALQRPAGQAGYAHGNTLARSNAAASAIAPGSIVPPKQLGATQVGQAALAAASPAGGLSQVYHFLHSLPVIGERLPENVQQKIGQMLFDPRQTVAAVNNLRRAGVQMQDIRRAGALAGAGVSARVSAYLGQQQ